MDETLISLSEETLAEDVLKETAFKEISESMLETLIKQESMFPVYDQLNIIKSQSFEGIKFLNQEIGKQLEGKETFYSKVYEDLKENNYTVYPEQQLSHGKGEHKNVRSGDGIAVKDNEVIVLEAKSPKEIFPNTLDDGTALKYDYLKDTREAVSKRVEKGELTKNVGKHEIFLAQAEYNTFNVNDGITGIKDINISAEDKTIKVGYSVPKEEMQNVIEAMKNKGVTEFKVLSGKNSTVTFVYDLPAKRPS